MDLNNTTVSAEDQVYVDRLRRFLNDTTELNILEEVKESTDIFLLEALQDALDDISFTPPKIKTYTTLNEVPWSILKLGATLEVLTGKGILSARNTLTYRDNGGVTVQDYDKYGRYINYYNILINKYLRKLMQFKVSENIDAGYDGGGVPSEYSNISSD
jgi:hypothetical protein